MRPRSLRLRRLALLAASLGLAAGCGDREAQRPPSPPPPAADEGPDRAEIERLMALGYLDHTEDVADPTQMRVVEIDRDRVQPGYRLYCNRQRSIAELIDVEGEPVRTWELADSLHIMSCLLLEDGDVIFVGIGQPAAPGEENVDSDRYLARLDWDGNERWRRILPVHHDVSRRPDGRFASLGLTYRRLPEIHPEAAVRDDLMMLLDGEGRVLETRSLYEALRTAPGWRLVPHEARYKWKVQQVDFLHSNTIEWMRHEALFERDPIYAPGNVLVTVRHQNLVAIVEWESNRVLWLWGQDDLIGPHEGSVLENGHVLVFDNGGERGYSRVIEVDPLRDEIVWEYKAPRPADFYTAARGGARRLPNGNTLITSSNNGYAFEVTPAGETVWKFMNPYLTEEGQRLTFRRMDWIPAAVVDALLANR